MQPLCVFILSLLLSSLPCYNSVTLSHNVSLGFLVRSMLPAVKSPLPFNLLRILTQHQICSPISSQNPGIFHRSLPRTQLDSLTMPVTCNPCTTFHWFSVIIAHFRKVLDLSLLSLFWWLKSRLDIWHQYKARQVTKRYIETYGIDYEETFALVEKINIIQILLSLDVNSEWELPILM